MDEPALPLLAFQAFTAQEAQAVWLRVLEEPVGVLLQSSDPALARARLNAARAELKLPELLNFTITLRGVDGEGNLTIVRSKAGEL